MKNLMKKEPSLRNWLKGKHSNQSMKGSKKAKRIANKSFRMYLKKANADTNMYKKNFDYEY